MASREEALAAPEQGPDVALTLFTLAGATVFLGAGVGLLLVMPVAGAITASLGGLLLAGVLGSLLRHCR